jgi:hypothetical protein
LAKGSRILEVNVRTASLMVVIMLLGCGGGPKPAPVTKVENYFPMAAGYEWKYSATEISYLDSVRAETTAGAENREIRCIGRKPMPNGREAWALHTYILYKRSPTQARAAKDTAMWITDTTFAGQADSLVLNWGSRNFEHPNTELVLPLREGRSWNVRGGKLYSTQATAVRQESVKVPAGEYVQAWRIEDSTTFTDGKTPPMRFVRWYAAGVGLVRTESEMLRANGTRLRSIDELVSAKTGK